jgi:hypothetical protein
MNEANCFDIYSGLIQRFGAYKIKIAEIEAQQRDKVRL